ncbi:hypothetical protein NV379_01590 [Paenibacillus sp. N1-5-1-14]|uniref:FtsX-like permease family protein n=1 Tax=Paenibacillus radicibacter TaxID=2972488 RepID=UPI0021598068|nr:FtsX-like permease family protein [Paenibacillus radicibacter]MCR8641337.1 hypothetical protein [Paenibacillus radicibacter]
MYRILIVEDEEKIAVILQEMLRKFGYEAIRATEFRDLKKEFIQVHPHLRQIRTISNVPILFVSILFFIASGSMLYFKLFTELEEDRRQFDALSRIGMPIQEISRVLTMQTAALFIIPCIVGAVHMLFAMKALSNIWNDNTIYFGIAVVGIYILMQLAYFFVARRMYMKRVLSGIVQ